MYKSRLIVRPDLAPFVLVLCGIGLCGCERSDKIEAYTVPKHDLLQTTAYLEDFARRHPKPVPKRMIGVVIPKEQMLWFLKLEGGVDAVAARENDVREFLKSLNLSNPQELQWTLPPGWKALPATEMRYATLVLDGEPPLEMSVTKLPPQPDLEMTEQVVQNINRWRGQLSLVPIEKDDLDTKAEKLQLNNAVAYWININGNAKPRPASMMQPQATAAKPKDAEVLVAPTFEKPSGWDDAPPTMFAKISLQAVDSTGKVVVTVTPAKGNPVDNVNRWRSQLKLEPASADELKSIVKKVDVGELAGDMYELTNGERTILGVIVEEHGHMWFVKLDGINALAERERPRFESFLKSLQFQ